MRERGNSGSQSMANGPVCDHLALKDLKAVEDTRLEVNSGFWLMSGFHVSADRLMLATKSINLKQCNQMLLCVMGFV